MDSDRTVLRSARHSFLGTALSRASGVMREMALAFCFGSSPEIAAFLVAFRLSNLFRRLIGEGNLQSGFIPQFEAEKGVSFERGILLYRDVAFSMAALALFIVAGSELFLWSTLKLLNEGWREIAELSMWMMPGLVFICLSGLNTAFLQSQKRYFWPSAAPIAFNAVWIGVALVGRDVKILAAGVAAAYGMQWAMTAFQARREWAGVVRWREWFKPRWFSDQWRGLMRPMSLGIVGVGAVQINSALDVVFARIADLSGPAYLSYAIRVEQLPLALFGIALSGALLPPLSRAMRDGEGERFLSLLSSGLRSSAALMIPCTFGLIALGASGLNLLFGRGDFQTADVYRTLECLLAYGAGLVPSVFVLLLAQGFYASRSYWIPARASLISVGVNIALNAWFVFGLKWGAVSIALATSCSAWVNCFILARSLKSSSNRALGGLSLRLTLASALPAAAAWAVQQYWLGELPRGTLEQMGQFILLASIYLGGLVVMAWALRIREVNLIK